VQQIVERARRRVLLGPRCRIRRNRAVKTEHLHAQPMGELRDQAADTAETDDAERAARKLTPLR
jgi:hypothetical protein